MLPDQLKLKVTPMRYAIFSPTLGVYLGDGRWSFVLKAGLKTINTAPTYEGAEALRIIAEWKDISIPVTDANAVEVWPDVGTDVSAEKIKDSLLPSWRD